MVHGSFLKSLYQQSMVPVFLSERQMNLIDKLNYLQVEELEVDQVCQNYSVISFLFRYSVIKLSFYSFFSHL